MDFKETTLGYIEWNGCYLMLYRNKKNNDPNEGKWIGIGGHIEKDEAPDDCFVREVREETGIVLKNFTKRGVVDFISDTADNERIHLYTASVDSSDCSECNEGTLKWVPKDEILKLNLWEGDKHFLMPLIAGETNIRLRLVYEGWTLVKVEKCEP
ncbi:MAG: 8-oxo-dGTP diphosphatase [Paludibacteraceae bacterium]|nr:8-oxo-dGTP diphosphatase [Paludibacteraceae bacterium]